MPNSTTHPYREIVATFNSAEALERAIGALASAGWDRAEMSLMAESGTLMADRDATALEGDTRDLADDDNVERKAVVGETDVRQGRTLMAGMAGVVGAFLASGATIMSGGTVLAAVIGAAVLGGGAGAAVEAIGRGINNQRTTYLHRQIGHGGILLWAKLRAGDQEQERKAREVLQQAGGSDVHVHAVPEDQSGDGASPSARPRDEVEIASIDSFPASDPPAWTGASAGAAQQEETPRRSSVGGSKQR